MSRLARRKETEPAKDGSAGNAGLSEVTRWRTRVQGLKGRRAVPLASGTGGPNPAVSVEGTEAAWRDQPWPCLELGKVHEERVT